MRADRHAAYVGTLGRDVQCPAHAVGRTESIVIQPLDAGVVAARPDLEGVDGQQFVPDHLTRTVSQEVHFAVPAAGVAVSASYGADFDVLTGVLRTARLDSSAPPTTMPAAKMTTTASIAATDTN